MEISKEKYRYLLSTGIFLIISVIIGIFVAINPFLGFIYFLMLLPFLILFSIPLFNNDFNKTSFKRGIIFAYLTFIPLYIILTFKSSNGFEGYGLIFIWGPLLGIFAMSSWVAMLIGIFSRNKENKLNASIDYSSNKKLSGQLILILILDILLLPIVFYMGDGLLGRSGYDPGNPFFLFGSLLLYGIFMVISFILTIKRKRSGLYFQRIILIFGLILIISGFFSEKLWVESSFLSPVIIAIIFSLFYLFFNVQVKNILKN